MLENENARRIGLIMKDITEVKDLLDQLTRTDKLAGLGTLAAGIAHEINNPLYAVMAYTEAITEQDSIPKIRELADKVLKRSKHMSSVILNLSGYARSTEMDEVREVDINERIDGATEMALMSSFSDDIELIKNYENVRPIIAKPEEIQQVFLNVIHNSVQAMDGKGKLEISSRQNGGNVVVQIRDTGPGIPKEHLSKVFDPFFTTREVGKGTGLGLNIVHRVVEKYGGNVQIESEVGQGTTVIISLPLSGKKGDADVEKTMRAPGPSV
jgi:signal transduction histidine kinase